ncbi:MAG: trigger factor, partial [Kiritimatiellae bacterium]|nr:trigger factor [Kiritimatiellia bacterium]
NSQGEYRLMKTESKKLDKCQVELNVTLDAEEVKAIVKEVEKAFMREARLPGFRPGKVPLELIRKNFAEGLKQEIERAMFQKNIAEAVKAEKLDEVGIADVRDMKHGEAGGGFTAVVEVKPTFKLPAYKGVKLGKSDAKVEDKAVEEQLQRLRTAYAKYEDAKEGETVAAGDFIQIDYTGTVDGKPIAEIAPEAKVVASGTGFWTQVEEGRFLPEILEAVKGMKAGETKEGVKAKFDKEAAPEGLKGAKAVYTVTLKAFRRRVLPTDAEFVEKAKAESLEKLTETVRGQMEREAARQEAERRENEAVEALLKKADFDVPGSQVRRAMDGYLKQLAERAQYAGLTQEYFDRNREKILKDAEEAATRQVRLWYIIEAIAREEKIEAGEGADADLGRKVLDFILANAK